MYVCMYVCKFHRFFLVPFYSFIHLSAATTICEKKKLSAFLSIYGKKLIFTDLYIC